MNYTYFIYSIQGLDGSSEISGVLTKVQDIEVLTEHVINVVRTKMREQNVIRVTLIFTCCYFFFYYRLQDTSAFVRPFVELFMDSTNAPRMYTVNKLLKKMVEFHPILAK